MARKRYRNEIFNAGAMPGMDARRQATSSRLNQILNAAGAVIPAVPANWALASKGASITANVTSDGAVAKLIDGSRNAGGNFSANGFQQNGNGNFIEITFIASKTISEYDVIFGSNSLNDAADPANTSVTSTFASVDFRVQAWNGVAYVTVATVLGNNKQWVQGAITPVATTKMKFIWDNVAAGAAYLLEVECWGV